MAILFLKETYGRAYTNSITGKKTGVKTYCVLFDTAYDELSDVVDAALLGGLPALLSSYGSSSAELSLVAVSHTPLEIDKEKKYYNIQINYESNRATFNPPTDQPWTVSFASVKYQYVPDQTLANAGAATGMPASVNPVNINLPILNTAGQPFDPPVVDLKTQIIISLRKNIEAVTDLGTITDTADLMGRVNTVNDDVSVVIAGITGTPMQFLLDEVNIVNVEANGEEFYAVDIRIIYDPEYHVQKILNAGWNEIKAGKTLKIYNENGGEISNPWPLDVNGAKIKGTPAARAAAAIYQGFAVKPLSTFADLSLPTAYGDQNDLPIT